MQHLTPVGLSEDKKRLLLVSDSGEEYSLAVDDKFRAALRGDHARLGQLEIQMDSALRPRDIQARIRSGESPETVAQAAQTTVERIMRYASPVLAERAHIAERAQRASVRRKTSEGPAKILGEVVADQLRAENVDPDSVDWDAWRRDDGRWALVADFRVTERTRKARFIFDVQGRYVVADDEDARWLVGEQTARKPRQARQAAPSARRLSPVVTEEELPLGDDAIEMVSADEPADEAVAGPEDKTVDLTQTAWELRRPERRKTGTTDRADRLRPAGDADWMATQASERPAAPRDRAAEEDPEAAARAADRAPEQTGAEKAGTVSEPEPDEPVEQERPKPAKKSARKGRRASVPSWDEIMFGGGRQD